MTHFIPHLSLSVLAIGSSVYCTGAFVPVPSRALRPNPAVPPRRIYNSMARRPIEEILLELDARGISFPPTATRSELERLLSDVARPTPELQQDFEDYDYNYYDDDNGAGTSREQQQQRRKVRVEPMNGNRRHRRRQRQTVGKESYEYDDDTINPREKRRQRRQQHMGPLAPADILFRVVDKTSKTVVQAIPEQVLDVGSKATRLASRTTKRLFYALVDGSPPKKQKDVGRKKRFDDTTELGNSKIDQVPSPGAHDWQWQEPNLDDQLVRDAPDTVLVETLSMGAESSTKDSGRIRIPLQELLSELNRRNIRYSPKSTRAELEDLLEQGRRSQDTPPREASMDGTGSATQEQDHRSSSTTTSAFSTVDDTLHDNIWRKASRVTVKKIKTVPKKLSETIGTRAKNTYQKARNSAASLFEDPSDQKENDNAPIIIDAIVEDITKQHFHDDGDVIDVEPLYRRERYRPPRRKRELSKSDDDQEDYRVQAKSRRHPRMYHQDMESTNNGRTTIDGPSMDQQQIPNTRLPSLNPAEPSQSQELKSKRDRGKRSNGDRTIYSPYRNGNDVYVDGLDRLGDFVANSVDSFLWGSDKEKVAVSASESPRPSSKQRRRSGNWKDKMEEQFDYLLGIHQDGEYYNRWVNEELDNKQNTNGTQGVSTTGQRKSRSRKERQLYNKPIWEEEGSILSMLFGTDKRSSLRSDMFDLSPSTNGSGSVVKILKTLLRSATLVVSGVCRWASVRGSLPQPLVVVGVLSSVLSSRPGARVRNIIFTILALRTVGELLHGYTNDDTEFWDPIDEDDYHDPMLQTGNQIP